MGKSQSITSKTVNAFTRRIDLWFRLSQEQREEVIGQSLAVYSQKVKSGSRIEKPLRWLMATAKILGRAIMRKEGSKINYEYREPRELERKCSPDRSPSENDARIRAAFEKAFSQLSENERNIVQMRDVEEITISNAARELGVPRSTAKSWYCRAHRKLKGNQTLQALCGEFLN